MQETRETLEARKREVFEAIRVLEQDRRDGLMNEEAYAASRRRYELEAAGILERLDHLPGEEVARERSRSILWVALPAAGLVLAALALFLISAVQQRTAAQPAALPTVSPVLASAQREAVAHPQDVDAQLALGNAYLDAGQSGKADMAYRRAMRLAPGRAEPPTFHAMALATEGRNPQALTLLAQVERKHPRYARAWLLDGLIASKTAGGYNRARAAWHRFLRLEPNSPVSASVRRWLENLGKKGRRP